VKKHIPIFLIKTLLLLSILLTGCPLPIDETLITVVEDEIPPELTIASPKTNSAYKGTITITGSILDSALKDKDYKGFIKTLEITVLDASRLNLTVTFSEDGTYQIEPEDSTFTFDPETGSFFIEISSIGLSGVQIITFTATDKNGNVTEKTINLQEDTSGPYIKLNTPANLTTYSVILNITGTVLNAQNDSSTENVKKVSWQISPAGVNGELDLTTTPKQPDGTYKVNKFTFNPVTGAFYDEASLIGKKGNQYFEFSAEDLNGHVSTETRQLIDSAQGPLVAITAYDQWYSSIVTTSTTVSGTIGIDDPANFDSLVYIIEQLSAPSIGDTITTYDLTAGTFSFTFNPIGNGMSGKLVITVTATDKAGRENSVNVDMYDDINPPDAPIVTGKTPTNNTTPMWNWTNPSGTADVRYQMDSEGAGGWTTEGSVISSYTSSSVLTEGSHTLYVQAMDVAGNWSASGSYAITVDTTPLSPPNGFSGATPTMDETPTWNWVNPSGTADVRYQMDSEGAGGWTTEGSVISSYTSSSVLIEGIHTLYVQVQDAAGNWSASGSYAITVDTTPLSPPNGFSGTTPTNNTTPTWNWTNPSGTADVRYQMDSEGAGGWTTEGSVISSYTSSSVLTEDSHTLYVQVQDAAGNWSASGSYAITVDTTPLSPPNGFTGATPTMDETPTWNWVNPSGTVDVRYQIDSESSGGWTVSGSVITTHTPGSNLSQGARTLYVQVRDNAGNWSVSGSYSITIDSIPDVTAPPLTNDNTPTWNWTNPSGTVDVRYQMDSESAGGWTIAGGLPTSYTPAALSDGNHTLYVQAQDASTNWHASGYATVTVDTQAPVPPNSFGGTASPTNNTTPDWNWTNPADAVDIRYQMDSESGGGWTVSGSLLTSHTPSTPLTENDHTLYVQAQDAAGNWSSSGSRLITVDTTGPGTVTFTGPVTPTTNKKPTWTWDNPLDLDAVDIRYHLDTDAYTNAGSMITDYTPLNLLSVGNHTLYIKVVDSAGNESAEASYTVEIQ